MKQEFLSNVRGHIRKLILTAWLLLVVTLALATTSVQAQGGCPAIPNQALGVEPTVIEALPLSPYIPEAPSTQLNESFYATTLEFDYDPLSTRIFLAGSPDGQGQLCADDLILLTSQDWAFKLDSRTSDRQRIVTTSPIDISHVFSAGRNQLMLELVDLSPDFYSASPIWLVMVEAQTPVIVLTATETPIPTQTPTPEPTATSSPTPTATPRPAVLSVSPPDISEETPTPGWLLVPIVGLVLFVLGVLLFLWLHRHRPILPVGEVKVYRDSSYVVTYPLAEFRKPVVTLGRAGDIGLDDEVLADYVAQFRARRYEDGEVGTVVEHLDPDDPQIVVDREPLQHGDQLQVGPFTLHYIDYTQETALIAKGEYPHV